MLAQGGAALSWAEGTVRGRDGQQGDVVARRETEQRKQREKYRDEGSNSWQTLCFPAENIKQLPRITIRAQITRQIRELLQQRWAREPGSHHQCCKAGGSSWGTQGCPLHAPMHSQLQRFKHHVSMPQVSRTPSHMDTNGCSPFPWKGPSLQGSQRH